jgi:hypothetical protein
MKEDCPTFRPTLHVSSSGGNLRVLIYIYRYRHASGRVVAADGRLGRKKKALIRVLLRGNEMGDDIFLETLTVLEGT